MTEYRHGVIDEYLPDSTKRLASETALQYPGDYLDVLRTAVPEVLRIGNVTKDQVIGIGVDFTSCTVLPVDKKGTPLCFLEKYRNRPHA